MKINKTFAQWLGLFLLGTALILVFKIFDKIGAIFGMVGSFLSILTPFIVGFAIAFLLYGPVNGIERLIRRCQWKWVQKIARPTAVLVVYLLAAGVLGLIVYAAIPALIRAVGDFIELSPTYYNNVMSVLEKYTAEGGLLEGFDIQGKVQEIFANLQQYVTVDRVISYLGGLMRFASSILEVVMAFIVSVYMLLSREALTSALRAVCGLVCKPTTMDTLSKYLGKIAKIFYSYFYSQAIDAVVVGILATIGLLIARLPHAGVLGMMLGLLNMIPYFGAIIGGAICVLVALLSGNFYGALFVTVYILVMQQIDANIIQPRIVGQTVGIRPIYVLLGITIGGGLFGFWGIFLGVPMIAVVQMLLLEYIRARKVKDEPAEQKE